MDPAGLSDPLCETLFCNVIYGFITSIGGSIYKWGELIFYCVGKYFA